jgi:hypothetical protein
VTLSTTNLTLTDVDTYEVTFDQANDATSYTLDTFDTTALSTNAAGWLFSYLYSLTVSGDKCTITREASLELPTADVAANVYYRLRKGNIGKVMAGASDGFWVNTFLGPLANTYWSDVTNKVWTLVDHTGGLAVISSPLTTAGDLYTYTGSNDRLPIGNAFEHLRTNSGATAPEWSVDTKSKAFTIETPVENNQKYLWQNEAAVEILGVSHASAGSTSVVFTISYNTSIASGGTTIHTDTCETATPLWDVAPSGTTSVPTNQIIQIGIGTVTDVGDVTDLGITIHYRENA